MLGSAGEQRARRTAPHEHSNGQWVDVTLFARPRLFSPDLACPTVSPTSSQSTCSEPQAHITTMAGTILDPAFALNEDGTAKDIESFVQSLKNDPEKLALIEADEEVRDIVLNDRQALQQLLQEVFQARDPCVRPSVFTSSIHSEGAQSSSCHSCGRVRRRSRSVRSGANSV